MKALTEYTVEEFHNMSRESLLTLLVEHDRDSDYADEHRLALGEECLSHQEVLELCVNQYSADLNEYLDGLVSFYKSI
jgi:predicted solute-binding protein